MEKIRNNKQVKEYLLVTIGSIILAVSLNAILLPNRMVVGGANGISVVLHALFGWNAALVLLAINIPLLGLCFLMLGKEIGIKTIYGSLVFPLCVGLTTHIPTLTHNIFLAAVFGGIVSGIGLGIEFRAKASTGGTAIISQIVHKYFKIPLGASVLFVDGLVIASALIAFNTETILFSLICLFLIGRVVDMVQIGFGHFKNLLVISEYHSEIKSVITKELDKGVTRIPIEGGYQEREKTMLMAVINEKDYSMIKERILDIDPHAFIVSMNASEVQGQGFSIQRILENIDY